MLTIFLMNKRVIETVIDVFYEKYPDLEHGLTHGGDPYRLLVMAILSAQCTDKRVNMVSKKLFERFPDPRSIAASKEGELEEYIYSIGLYNSKAKSLRACCKTLMEDFGGEVPSGFKELLSLGGVGRKVANLIRGDVFDLGGIVADTHLIRISNRLGLVDTKNPLVVEKTLSKLIPTEKQTWFCHRAVEFGRDVCRAKNPDCDGCPIKQRNACNGIKK